MALTIQNIQRIGTGTCYHYRVTVAEDAQTATVEIHRDDAFDPRRLAQEIDNPKVMLAVAWLLYKVRVQNATLASLIGATVA